jgi:hypothetical protein
MQYDREIRLQLCFEGSVPLSWAFRDNLRSKIAHIKDAYQSLTIDTGLTA